MLTRKEKSDGQKQKVKGRLVAKGFQEKEVPQSDSPTMLRESMKMFFTVAANEDFELRKIDIRAAFLQAKQLDRDVFLKPPKDIRKPLYRLNDASRKFWLRKIYIRAAFLQAKQLDRDVFLKPQKDLKK